MRSIINIKQDKQSKLFKNLKKISNLLKKTAFSIIENRGIYINIILTNKTRILELNREYRKKNKETDVLSFPVWCGIFRGRQYAGDIFIYPEIFKKKRKDFFLKIKIQQVLIHGILHLLGYDHEQDDDWERMELIESHIHRNLNIDQLLKRLK